MNTSTNNVTIESVVNKPTTNAGELRAKDWTTLLANSINEGELVVTQFDTHVEASYNGETYTLELPTLFCASLMPAFRNETSLAECLTYLSKGCLSNRMLAVQEHIENKGLTPVAREGRVLTAEEYLTNCYLLNLDKKNLDKLVHVFKLSDAISDKSTKSEILAVLGEFKSIFISDVQAETYEKMQEADRQDAIKFQGLVDAGFENIVRHGAVLTASIDVSKSKEGLATLVSLGFNLVHSTFNSDTMTINVSFDESDIEAI